MFKITTLEAATLIKAMVEETRAMLNRNMTLRDIKSNLADLIARDLEGADDNGEVTAVLHAVQNIRTKAGFYNTLLDAGLEASTFHNNFTKCRRADLTIKRCAEQGFTVTRSDVFSTKTAKLNDNYSVDMAVAELRNRQNANNVKEPEKVEKDDIAQNAPRVVWVISKPALSVNWDALPFETYIDRREVMKETVKGMRLAMRHTDKGSFYSNERYAFFDSEAEALEYLADQANKAAEVLETRKLSIMRLLCEAHDALRVARQNQTEWKA